MSCSKFIYFQFVECVLYNNTIDISCSKFKYLQFVECALEQY